MSVQLIETLSKHQIDCFSLPHEGRRGITNGQEYLSIRSALLLDNLKILFHIEIP